MITPDNLSAFVDLVQQVRTMQEEYRGTICPRLRHRLPLLELELDVKAERLRVYLLELALQVEADLVVIGGAA